MENFRDLYDNQKMSLEESIEEKRIEEGVDSIPKLERMFKDYLPSDIIGSLMYAFKNNKLMTNKLWNVLNDVYSLFYSEQENNK